MKIKNNPKLKSTYFLASFILLILFIFVFCQPVMADTNSNETIIQNKSARQTFESDSRDVQLKIPIIFRIFLPLTVNMLSDDENFSAALTKSGKIQVSDSVQKPDFTIISTKEEMKNIFSDKDNKKEFADKINMLNMKPITFKANIIFQLKNLFIK